MKFNTLNPTYGNNYILKSFCWRPRDLRKFTKFVCYRASYERCNHGRWSAAAGCTERRAAHQAGSSQMHSMTLAAPGPVELRLRYLKLTESHRMITSPLSCIPRYWLLLAAP